MTEFELIARYFDRPATRTRLGVGDDCALLDLSPGHVLATSTDMLVAGRHFFDDVDPAALGWKTLAVNLSDLAAIGAAPLAFTLALALPGVDERWLAAFSTGLFECAERFDCELIGGDTTRGPLTLCVTVFGELLPERALRRDRAVAGDDVWVSGALGRAALALERIGGGGVVEPGLRAALERPMPRVALGRALGGIAHAAIDVSDGLVQDLGHIATASARGVRLDMDAVPFGSELLALQRHERARLGLAGGDDYELCFTAPRTTRAAVLDAAHRSATPVTRIGEILHDPHAWDYADWTPEGVGSLRGFDHFA